MPKKKTDDPREEISRDPREHINVPALIKALQRHALGKEEMTSTQVSAAIALLKKVLPDLPAPVRAAESAASTHEEALRELE